jgi:hypothetical protein
MHTPQIEQLEERLRAAESAAAAAAAAGPGSSGSAATSAAAAAAAAEGQLVDLHQRLAASRTQVGRRLMLIQGSLPLATNPAVP